VILFCFTFFFFFMIMKWSGADQHRRGSYDLVLAIVYDCQSDLLQ
jgi:hypothetical protein